MPHVVRRVLENEYPKYRKHLLALDADSRLLRFGFIVSEEVLNHLCDNFEEDHEHHILFCIENSNLEFIAIGHISTKGEMELAFSVLKEHQAQGMGDALMRRCIQWCRTHGILKGCMVCLSHNGAIRHLCTKHGIHFHSSHGETEANIELDTPSIITYVSEATDSNLGAMDYVSKRFARPWKFASN